MSKALHQWLNQVLQRPGGDILLIQTLRNAIMVAGVLASAALVGLMGLLSLSSKSTPQWVWLGAGAAGSLVLATALATAAMFGLAQIGFSVQVSATPIESAARGIRRALSAMALAAVLLCVGLALGALRVL